MHPYLEFLSIGGSIILFLNAVKILIMIMVPHMNSFWGFQWRFGDSEDAEDETPFQTFCHKSSPLPRMCWERTHSDQKCRCIWTRIWFPHKSIGPTDLLFLAEEGDGLVIPCCYCYCHLCFYWRKLMCFIFFVRLLIIASSIWS